MNCPRCSFRLTRHAKVCARCGEQAPGPLGLVYDTRPPAEGPRSPVQQELNLDRRGRSVRPVGASQLRARNPMWVRGRELSERRPGPSQPPAAASSGTSAGAAVASAPPATAVYPFPSAVAQAKTEPDWRPTPMNSEPALRVSRVSFASLPVAAVIDASNVAPLRLRAGAALIDAGVVGLALGAAALAGAVAFGVGRLEPFVARGFDYVLDDLVVGRHLWLLLAGLGFCLAFAYATLAHALLGGTFGKRLFGLSVVDEDGERISLGVSAVRTLASFAGFACTGLGHAFAVFDPRHLALHDRLVGTTVVVDELPSDEAPAAPAEGDGPALDSTPP